MVAEEHRIDEVAPLPATQTHRVGANRQDIYTGDPLEKGGTKRRHDFRAVYFASILQLIVISEVERAE